MGEMTAKQKVLMAAGAALAVFFVLGLLGIIPILRTSQQNQAVTINVWGVFDDSKTWDAIFAGYEARGGVDLVYSKKPFDEYERDMLKAFADDSGPQIFMLHNTWLPTYQDILSPMPQSMMTYNDFSNTFADVASFDFTRNGAEIYAVPFYADTLALYYNKDLLNAAGRVGPPETWSEFQSLVEDITIVDVSGNITKAGAAMGTAENINRSTDIFSLLMLQTFYPQDPVDPDIPRSNLTDSTVEANEVIAPGIDALRFYTDFANPALKSYTWNRNQPYSIDAFVDGDAAMMLNYSHHIPTIRSRAPDLNFAVGYAPQLSGLLAMNLRVDYANYFGFGVSRFGTAEQQEVAWDFLNYLATAGPQWQYHQLTNRPPIRRDLIGQLLDHPDLSVFAQQALTAKSWYMPNATELEQYLADMIVAVLDGEPARDAIERVHARVGVQIRQMEGN